MQTGIPHFCKGKFPIIAKAIASIGMGALSLKVDQYQKRRAIPRMLTMATIDNIRDAFFRKGWSKSKIAKEFKIDRKTVKKYLGKNNWNETPQIMKERPHKLDHWIPIIDKWLEDDQNRRNKQRHTAKRVYIRLVEEYDQEGFDCKYRTVAYYVAEKRKELSKEKTGSLPLIHPAGEAQFDFGEADFIENGKLYQGHYLNISFPFSNAGFLQLFKGENFECFAQGCVNIFQYIGGVPTTGWFDNASTLVTKILKEGNRSFTNSFLRFKNHYQFLTAFCNPASGHEKGSVEAKVGYHRRNLLVPIPEFENLEEYNKNLLERCAEDMKRPHYRKGKSISALFEEDKEKLLTLPYVPFEAVRFHTVKADGYGKITLKGRYRYSTRPQMAGKSITIGLKAYTVEIYDESMRSVVSHRRLYGAGAQESMEWIPYLKQLSKRPAALKYTGIYKLLPDAMRSWLDQQSRSTVGKALLLLAELTEESDFETAAEALNQALSYGVQDFDSIKMFHNRLCSPLLEIERINLSPSVPVVKELKPDVSRYDHILQKRGAHERP